MFIEKADPKVWAALSKKPTKGQKKRVATPEGAKHFGVPIGTEIGADGEPAKFKQRPKLTRAFEEDAPAVPGNIKVGTKSKSADDDAGVPFLRPRVGTVPAASDGEGSRFLPINVIVNQNKKTKAAAGKKSGPKRTGSVLEQARAAYDEKPKTKIETATAKPTEMKPYSATEAELVKPNEQPQREMLEEVFGQSDFKLIDGSRGRGIYEIAPGVNVMVENRKVLGTGKGRGIYAVTTTPGKKWGNKWDLGKKIKSIADLGEVLQMIGKADSGVKLYYFEGRNTGIAATSVEEARKKMKRGGDKLVKVRTPNESERKQMRRGEWVRTRADGKSPGESSMGKGRGYGPPRVNKSDNQGEEAMSFLNNYENTKPVEKMMPKKPMMMGSGRDHDDKKKCPHCGKMM